MLNLTLQIYKFLIKTYWIINFVLYKKNGRTYFVSSVFFDVKEKFDVFILLLFLLKSLSELCLPHNNTA